MQGVHLAQIWEELKTAMSWVPNWAIATGVVVLIVAGGLLAQSLIIGLVNRLSFRWHPLLRSLFTRTRTVARFGLFIFAVIVASPLFPLKPATAIIFENILTASLAVLIGWVVLVASNLAVDNYMLRFKLDVTDNLHARKAVTQMRVLKYTIDTFVIIVAAGLALMSFESVRRYGISLFASAGVAGLVAGLAARPVLSNVIAGIQLALSQPIRIDDVVVVEGEWGNVEEFSSTYVVIRIWDLRRLIVPLSYFLEKPFQNWTRSSASLLASVMIYADYTVPVDRVRERLVEIVRESKHWDGRTVTLQVTDATERTVELRALMSADNSSAAWDLRCEVREKLIAFLQQHYPHSLPRRRNEVIATVEK
jgi:small-conductance mechanosensitive channel